MIHTPYILYNSVCAVHMVHECGRHDSAFVQNNLPTSSRVVFIPERIQQWYLADRINQIPYLDKIITRLPF
jgi:hypothetical protein